MISLIILTGCNYQSSPEKNRQLIEMGTELMKQSKGY